MAEKNGNEPDNIKDIVEDIESLGMLSMTDFEDMEIMREDETFATMVEENISDEEMDELTRAFADLEDQISVPPTTDDDFSSIQLDAGEFGDMSEDDLDAMLKSLMQDGQEDSEDWVPIENVDAALEQKPEIYEGEGAAERDIAVADLDSKKVKRIKLPKQSPRKWIKKQYSEGDKGTKVLVTAVIAMSGLVAASILFLAGVLISSNFSGADPGTFNVSPPPYAFNNASHSLVNLSASLGEDTIVLNRLLLDEVATVFYFAGNLDPARYIFALEDFDGRVYPRNVALMPNHQRNRAQDQTVVYFAPIDPMAEGFVISITDLNTGQTTDIELTFDENAVAPGRYITSPIVIETEIPGITIAIDSGTFSAATSSLSFSIGYANPNISLVFSQDTIVPSISMRHMGAIVPTASELSLSHFSQDNIILGTMDFNPLRSLTGRVEIVFGQLYKRYDTDISIATNGMYTANDNRAREIQLSGHTINIHGINNRGNIFIMPLFGAERASADEEAIRIATTLEVYLVGTNDQGRQFRVPGTVIYDARGTDVIFDASEHQGILSIARDNLYLEIESISVRLSEVSANIYFDDMNFETSNHENNIKSAIESAFAREMPQFAAQFGAVHDVEHAVQVRQIHFDRATAYGRVVERLAFTYGGTLHEVIRHHSIVANVGAESVEIVEIVVDAVEQRP